MNVCLVYLDILGDRSWRGAYSNGVGSLVSVLKKSGIDVSMVHVTQPIRASTLVNLLSERRPDLIGFSTTTLGFPYVSAWAGPIKKHLGVPTICGGVHPTLCPGQSLNVQGVDMICVGEGERAFVELCEKMKKGSSMTDIANIWVKKDGEIFKNPPRPLIGNLDSLPFADPGIFDYKNLNLVSEGKGVVMASRGCPYNCSYCCNHAIKMVYQDPSNYVRFRSVDNVIAEIKELLAQYPFLKSIHFDDDILPLRKRWFGTFIMKYKKEIAIPFECNIRPDLVTADVVELLAEGGCNQIQIGLESGNDFIRQRVLNRNITRQQLVNAFSLCKKAGIKTYSFNMVGIPFEDPSKVLQTIKLNAEVQPRVVQSSVLFPFPNTKLHRICKEQNLLTKRSIPGFFVGSTLDLKNLSLNQIVFFKVYFRLLVKLYGFLNMIPSWAARFLTSRLDRLLASEIASNTLFPLLVKSYRALEAPVKMRRHQLRQMRLSMMRK